jgi:hypothetical protein
MSGSSEWIYIKSDITEYQMQHLLTMKLKQFCNFIKHGSLCVDWYKPKHTLHLNLNF